MPNANDPHRSLTPDPALADRVQRLEEHAGFAEHTVEQLSAEILELNKRLADTARRLSALEARLSRILDPAEQPPAAETDV
jgi:uncharacterized coiled-coil protein SlyX